MDKTSDIPYIDDMVRFVGVSKLREMNTATLRNLDKTLVIQEGEQPLAVLISYGVFLEIQEMLYKPRIEIPT